MSEYHVIQTPKAESDIIESAVWYELQKKGLGDEFFLCIDAEINFIVRNPFIYSKIENEIRRALVNRFPYGIFYLIERSDIIIISVTHLRRNPKQWKLS